MSILDDHPADAGAIQFEELANALLEQGHMQSPAELHGCLCGLLGGGFAGSDDDFLAALEKTLDLSLHGSLVDNVVSMRQAVTAALAEGDFDFSPLLPDDDIELSQRTEVMASWCRGFLSGYAQARVVEGATSEAVAPDSAEVLRDFAAIAQAGGDPEEDESEDDAETHYEELVEYLRVAAMNVLLDAGVGDEP